MRSTDYAAGEVPQREALIPGWPGYMVNDLGHLFSCHRHAPGGRPIWRPLSIFFRKCHYYARLYADSEHSTNVAVRKLVARAFLGERPMYTKLYSLDKDGANHRLANLAYLDREEAKRRGLLGRPRGFGELGEKHHNAKLTADQATEARRLYWSGEATVAAVADRMGCTVDNIRAILRRRTWAHVQDGFPVAAIGVRKPPSRRTYTREQEIDIARQSLAGRRPCDIWRGGYEGILARDVVNWIARRARRIEGLPKFSTGGVPITPKEETDPCPPPTATSE
jgi:hypothetical protein